MNCPSPETIFIDDNGYNVDSTQSIGITAILYKDLASLRESPSELGIN